jgi:Rod binding domain-containing protein
MQIINEPARQASQRIASNDARDPLTRQAQIFVSQAFFGTMFKMMRQSPWHSDMFDGGRAGQAFGSMLDQHLAERMARRGAAAPVVHSIVKRLEKLQQHPKPADEQQNDPLFELNHAVRSHVAPTFRT